MPKPNGDALRFRINLGALLDQRAHGFDVVERPRQVALGPDVFADGDADLFAAEDQRRDAPRRLEVAILVENIVGGQKRLMRLRHRRAGLQEGGGIVKWLSAILVSIDETDEQTGAPDMRLELFQDLEILRDEPRLEDQVLRRITGNGKLRRNDQFRSSRRQPIVGAGDLFKIAAQISDDGIDLSEADLHAVGRKLCAARRSAIPFEAGYRLVVGLTAGVVFL